MLTAKLNKNTNSGKVLAALSIVVFTVLNMAMLPCIARAAGSGPLIPPAFYNVYDYGAKGDGTTDDTGPFQNALNAASNAGGGIVYAPRGQYRIDGTLTIPAYVTLKGVFTAPPARPYQGNKGTILLAYSGRGNEQGPPLIQLGGDCSTLQGVTIFYPEQNNPSYLVQYPWTIRGMGGDNNTIQDVLLVNPWRGVDFATNASGRHLIRSLYGQPLRTGIFVDRCLDIGRIEDIHFWPFWSESACPQMANSQGAARALILHRSDWQIVHNFFAFGYHTGISFDQGFGGTGTNGQFSNINIDGTNVGLDIYHTQPWGIQISNLNIACGNTYGQDIRLPILSQNGSGIGPLMIVNGSFWGPIQHEAIRWEAGDLLNVTSCVFKSWGSGDPAIRILGGRSIIQGNYFQDLIGKSVYIGSNAERTIIHGNQLTGNPIESYGTQVLQADNQP